MLVWLKCCELLDDRVSIDAPNTHTLLPKKMVPCCKESQEPFFLGHPVSRWIFCAPNRQTGEDFENEDDFENENENKDDHADSLKNSPKNKNNHTLTVNLEDVYEHNQKIIIRIKLICRNKI